jgi:hypothetical protein
MLCGFLIAGCRTSQDLTKGIVEIEQEDSIALPAFWGNAGRIVWGGPRFKGDDLPFGPGLYVFLLDYKGGIDLSKERATDMAIRFYVWNTLTQPVFLKAGEDLVWIKHIDMRSERGERRGSGSSRIIMGGGGIPVLSDSSVDRHFVLLNGSGSKLSDAYDAYEFGSSLLDHCAYPSSWTGTVHLAFDLEGYVLGDGTRFRATLETELPVLGTSTSSASSD